MREKKIQDLNYGYNVGRKYRSLFKVFHPLILNIDKETLFYSQKHLSTLAQIYPQKLQRLQGLCSALGINIEKLHSISICLGKLIKVACTNSFITSPATSDGKTYLTWNVDIFSASRIFFPFLRLMVVDIPNYKKYIGFGAPIMGAIGILNEDGLSYVATAVGLIDGNNDGLLDMEINNLCMEKCSDTNEVIKTYKENKLQSISGLTASIFLNLNCIWGDAKGDGVAIEHSANYLHFEKSKSGILAIANHHQYLDRKLTGSVSPDQMRAITGSYCRLTRMWNLLEENYGKVDLKIIKNIVSDHNLDLSGIQNFNFEEPVDDGTICCHYWNIMKYIKERKFKRATEAYFIGKTLLSYIIEPNNLLIHRCVGNPCKNHFWTHNFSDALIKSSYANVRLFININSKINTAFYKIPEMKKFMDFLFKKIIKKFLIFIVSFFEKIIPVSINRRDDI